MKRDPKLSARAEARKQMMPLLLWMVRQDVTEVELSKGIGLSKAMINHIFNGRRRLSLDVARSIETFTRGEIRAAVLLLLVSEGRAA
jgi:antitoxin component HigA of HigAB toxin-antitoxin module